MHKFTMNLSIVGVGQRRVDLSLAVMDSFKSEIRPDAGGNSALPFGKTNLPYIPIQDLKYRNIDTPAQALVGLWVGPSTLLFSVHRGESDTNASLVDRPWIWKEGRACLEISRFKSIFIYIGYVCLYVLNYICLKLKPVRALAMLVRKISFRVLSCCPYIWCTFTFRSLWWDQISGGTRGPWLQ